MNVFDRQQYILDRAELEGYVDKAKMAEELELSIETVRRDIQALCKRKLLKRVKGGAMPIAKSLRKETAYTDRAYNVSPERITIGHAAAAMIRDGDIVAFDSGTSIQTVAEAVTDVHDVTFVTDSLQTALVLYGKIEKGEITGKIILIGGELHGDRCTAGSMADDAVKKFHFDTAFICCTALSLECVSSANLNLCHFSKHLMDNASVSVLVAESKKVGKNSLFGFAQLEDFSEIIIDDKHPLHDEVRNRIEEAEVRLTIVKSR